ncbi:hypothetical protein HMPREF1868_00522 [Olsenella sp. DNF00959]|nr:hypothetical protein HMPREF1868_00522 [Olsenella sp. DNF00959]
MTLSDGIRACWTPSGTTCAQSCRSLCHFLNLSSFSMQIPEPGSLPTGVLHDRFQRMA